jgi:predicted nucleotidyltransferase
VFTPAERDALRESLLERARADSRIVAAAVTGSAAVDAADAWSDIDLFFGVDDEADRHEVIEDWTRALDPVHHFDLASPAKAYRVFLLENGLEVDLGFTSARDFAASSPRFRLVFGEHAVDETRTEPDARYETGLGWHHILHARACIARGKRWQAVWLINGVRDHTITLASLRLGIDPWFARGADELPLDDDFAETLVRSTEPEDLTRALAAVRERFLAEVGEHDARLAERFRSAT